ncbi:hypothetical protein B7494_g6688 [Chlorociboria aeruginascens]|nr:hypothetical protein B7494_g6688 [Chlorociboria aeruginascens]
MDESIPPEINVITYNVWGLKYIAKFRNQRLTEIGKRIAAADPVPHIVGLQECWTQEDYQSIRQETSMILPYGKFYHSGCFGGGLAILSKWPIEESSMVRYPLNGRPTAFFRGDWYVGKGVACARIRYGSGSRDIVEVFTTHLHAPYESEPNDSYICHRTAQAWEIAKLMRGAAERGHLVIGLGDFNMIPQSLAHRLISTHSTTRDLWLILHPDSSVGAAVNEVEKARRRPIPTADFNLIENGATCDGVLNTWRWNKGQQKLLGPKKPEIEIPRDTIDVNAKRLDYIFANTGYNPTDPERGGWVVKTAKVGMLSRHPDLQCSLSDHFSVEATLIHSSSTSSHTAKEEDSAVNDGVFLQSPATSEFHSSVLSAQLKASASPSYLPISTYDEILTMICKYHAREIFQRRARLGHFFAWVCLGAGIIDGLIGGLFVSTEIRALKEFEWEIQNVRATAGGDCNDFANEGIKDCQPLLLCLLPFPLSILLLPLLKRQLSLFLLPLSNPTPSQLQVLRGIRAPHPAYFLAFHSGALRFPPLHHSAIVPKFQIAVFAQRAFLHQLPPLLHQIFHRDIALSKYVEMVGNYVPVAARGAGYEDGAVVVALLGDAEGGGRRGDSSEGWNLAGRGDGGDFEALWDILRSALREIHEKNASKLSFEQLYRASYKIVLKKQGDRLYDRVREFEEQWFGTTVMPGIRKLITNNLLNISLGGLSGSTGNERRLTGEEFLKGLKVSWEDHNTCMNMTTDVLMYMDRVYCGDHQKASIFTAAMGLYRDHILRSRLADSDFLTFDILNSVVLDQIAMEREGDVINRHLIRSVVYMLEGLYESDDENEHEKLYLTVFEIEFLNKSRIFYQNECLALLRGSDTSSWLRQTQKRLAEESDRCNTTISKLTSKKIQDVVDQELIKSHLAEFLAMEGSGIKAMIENDRLDDLAILYRLIKRVDPSKEPLKNALQSRVMDLGGEINKNILATDFSVVLPEDGEAAQDGAEKGKKLNAAARQTAAAIRWVDDVLQLKDKFDNLWKKCLDSDLILQTALTKSFSDFINLFPRSSEYVSLFIDDNLKRGIKGKTEAEIDIVLDKATILVRYIQDKDMFERYYKKHLARRLLHGKSESGDVEKQMITRMKQEVGNTFTSKLEAMFKDMALSEDLTAGYRTYIQNLGDMDRKHIDLGINLLTANCWPMEAMGGGSSVNEDGTRQTCQWPPEILALQDSFKAFYHKDRNGRKLTWLGFLGSADIKCVFPKIPGKDGVLGKERRHELNVPTYGMIILVLFNDLAEGQKLSFEEIHERTGIPQQDLSKILHTIAVIPKCRVLNKHPSTKETPKPGDKFSFNSSFTSKAIKIKAPVVAGAVNKVEGEDERKDTEGRNDEHRGSVIDTHIVRIMKARKVFSHQQLFAEVITQLAQRFKPDVGMMKRRGPQLDSNTGTMASAFEPSSVTDENLRSLLSSPHSGNYDLILDITRYIPIGSLRIFKNECAMSFELWKSCNVWHAFAHPRDFYNPGGGRYLLNAVQELLLNSSALNMYRGLHNAAWIRMEFRMKDQHSGQVRVYLLPDDVGRGAIDRHQRSLRASLHLLLAQLDTSKSTWNGNWSDDIPVEHIDPHLNGESEDNTSLFYLFNTLPSPNPEPEIVENQYARDAMCRILDNDIDGLNTPMYTYQKQSAAMMLQREAQPAMMIDPRLRPIRDQNGEFWYCDLDAASCFRDPRMFESAKGGICAETMGLGKTLICLALILATRDLPTAIPVEYSLDTIPVRKTTGSLIEMCAATVGRTAIPWKTYFAQLAAEGYEHSQCIEAIERSPAFYYLPVPAQRRASRNPAAPRKIYLTSATLVVVPPNLVHQWRHEIRKHTTGLKVLVMADLKSELPTAKYMIQYDIILFSKQRFDKEARDGTDEQGRRLFPTSSACQCPFFAGTTKRNCTCSHQNRFYRSPLKDLHFKRLIIDEGHTFGNASSSSKTEAMTVVDFLQLSARWIISGTPTQGLYGSEVNLSGTERNSTAGTPVDLESTLGVGPSSPILSPDPRDSPTSRLEKATKQERKDLEKLGNIATIFLQARPWAKVPGHNDAASWSQHVMQPRHGSKGHGNMTCLRSTLEGMIIRHRAEDVLRDVELPPMEQKIVYLDGSLQDRMALNTFSMVIVSNAVTSQRQDADYLFHPTQRRSLLELVANLRQASFFWSGLSKEQIQDTIDLSKDFLEKKNFPVGPEDEILLKEAIKSGEIVASNKIWQAISSLHEIPMYVQNYCLDSARKAWSLDDQPENPTLMGISMVHALQKFVEGQIWKSDPMEGLIEEGNDVMKRARNTASKISPVKHRKNGRFVKKPQPTVTDDSNGSPAKDYNSTKKLSLASLSLAGARPRANEYSTTNFPHVDKMVQEEYELKGYTKDTLAMSSAPPGDFGSQNSTEIGCMQSSTRVTDIPPKLKPALKQPSKPDITGTLDPSSPLLPTAIVSTSSAKLSYLMDKVFLHHATEKILIFYEADDVAYYIAQALECLGIQFLIYSKTLSTARRSQYIVTFNGSEKFRVLLMDVSQAAFGLDMSSASRVFFLLRGSIEEVILQRRKDMSTEEVKECKTILDDVLLYDWIKNVRFLPLPEEEVAGADQMAKLQTPQLVFGRGARSFLHPDDDLVDEFSSPKSQKGKGKARRRGTSPSMEDAEEFSILHNQGLIGPEEEELYRRTGRLWPQESRQDETPEDDNEEELNDEDSIREYIDRLERERRSGGFSSSSHPMFNPFYEGI